MRFSIVSFPGSNCDRDCLHVVREVLGEQAELVWHTERDLRRPDCVILPGGFAHGDYLRPGALAKLSPVMDEVRASASKGGPILGICNGFQVLLEARLLPGSLLRNRPLDFVCRHQALVVSSSRTPSLSSFTAGDALTLPIAHAYGQYHIDEPGLERLEGEGRVALRYAAGENPNGSVNDIAAICDEHGKILGMMPHPERASEPILGSSDGLRLFQGLLAAIS